MASWCTKRFCANERFIIRRDADRWRSELIHSVGLDNILEVFLETQVLEDIRLLKDCKPASVSNWSFDENCLFCCLRREKVKEHVVALNKQIVDSGGKPLLGKDPSNITRLEWQSEEFLNAVLHSKEYTPRIPDPHIPVVACGILQQMINELASHYTSRNNCSQDSLQSNGKKDQSLLKASCITSSTAVKIDSVASAQKKLIMVDQDAPLDLSLRKIKVEDFEQDGVLDLSTKNLNKGHTSLRNSHVGPATHLVKRDSIDSNLAQVKDLQSVNTLEQFMSKLCLHHQHQIVDALGLLQSEVKTVAASNPFQAPTPDLSEKQATTSCSYASFETSSEIQQSERTCSVDAAVSISKTQESSVVRTSQKPTAEVLKADVSSIARVMTENQVGKMEVLSSSCGTGVECGNASSATRLFVMTKTTTDNLGAKKVFGSSIQQIPSSKSVKTCLCSAERCLPTCTAEADHADLSKCTQKCFAQNEDAVVKPSTIQNTSSVVVPISPRTARKSRKGSCLIQTNGSLSCLINDPDSHCDLVYIRKSITECQPQSRNRLHPRQNARKSTRGHKYVEEYLELKTVRTLAPQSIGNSSGNCPAHMLDMHTSVTPKQVLSKSGSVPLVNTPFAGDCMKNVIPKLPSEQIAENEMPGDVVKVTSLGLMVETSQTGNIESNGQIFNELSDNQTELTMQPDLISEKHMDTVEESTETTELAVQKDRCDSQIGPMPEEVVCGTERKAECEDKSLEPSLIHVSPNMANECCTDEVDIEPRNEREITTPTEVETAADVQEQSEASEIKASTEEDRGAQEQVVHGTESNLQTANSSDLPVKNQEDSAVSSLTEVSTVQPLVKCKEKDVDLHTSKVLNAKQAVPSGRCLRSRSKGSVDVTKDSTKCGASELVDHANDKSSKAHSTETNVHTEQEPDLKAVESVLETAPELPTAKPCNGLVVDHAVKSRPKSKSATAVGRDEHPSPGDKVNNDLPSVLSPEVLPETASTTSTLESGKHHKLNNQASESTEKMPLRNKSSPVKLSDSRPCSPIKKSPPSSENMHLRSRSNTEEPLSSKSVRPTEGHSEKQGQMPLRSSSSISEQTTNRDMCTSEAVTYMPLRSGTVGSIKPTVTKDSPVKSSSKRFISEQPVSSHSSTTCRKTEANGHMPLRSSASLITEQPRSNKSAIVDASESPGRMSLRRGNVANTENSCGSTTTPSRNKRPLKQQRVSASSGEAEESPLSSKLKIQNQKHVEAQIRGSLKLPDESFRIASLQATGPVVCSPPKFLEALRGEEHQQLISNLNSKFDKMHKSWVPMDKEGQPAPKPKNKADRLKEIWKSKRRVRKSRSLEQQKLSPVQMLFMKPFDLSSICRWFLQSTETKSLVIVKKVNTRLPSETQLCFHTSAAGAGSSHGIFPSLQAERLKKHLKKFAIASPVKNNPKNQRLLSKALGQGISAMRSKEKHEPTTATRICTKAQSLAGVTPAQAPESLAASAGSAKNPASARILRKYSNMREKLQVQQNKKCKEKTFKGARLKAAIIPKKANKQKLPTHKGSKSVVVQRISSLTKTAKTNSALKQRALKRNQCCKDGASPKRLQALRKTAKAIGESASTNSSSKKQILIKSGTDKAQQIKASLTKADTKKPAQKGPGNLESQSLDMDVKPLTLEDQVLTRSQRKMEGTPSQTVSPKSSTKRGLEPLVTPTKRTRTSKP
ncbi:uncharacterized protein wu:fc17b08 isoform X2 [Onychostoma macrolepis]|uniref:Ligand-dependent corepressor n=1 Tax=Onychostoma macrolepis TaxID=369639 RepID=A0A7J6CI31_9TELE|nr:uncharacterized protein wu:fc17b08 isoform X2 [Onychostoma macrolepis]KAF4105382.1 hypothetical protein G5714_013044 [Onychostoma macrolepis]